MMVWQCTIQAEVILEYYYIVYIKHLQLAQGCLIKGKSKWLQNYNCEACCSQEYLEPFFTVSAQGSHC